jgi:hypothetical protein
MPRVNDFGTVVQSRWAPWDWNAQPAEPKARADIRLVTTFKRGMAIVACGCSVLSPGHVGHVECHAYPYPGQRRVERQSVRLRGGPGGRARRLHCARVAVTGTAGALPASRQVRCSPVASHALRLRDCRSCLVLPASPLAFWAVSRSSCSPPSGEMFGVPTWESRSSWRRCGACGTGGGLQFACPGRTCGRTDGGQGCHRRFCWSVAAQFGALVISVTARSVGGQWRRRSPFRGANRT